VAAQRIVNRKNLLSDQQFDAVDHASEPGPAGGSVWFVEAGRVHLIERPIIAAIPTKTIGSRSPKARPWAGR
jgi:hypothetical protein